MLSLIRISLCVVPFLNTVSILGLISVPINIKIGNFTSGYALAMDAQVIIHSPISYIDESLSFHVQ